MRNDECVMRNVIHVNSLRIHHYTLFRRIACGANQADACEEKDGAEAKINPGSLGNSPRHHVFATHYEAYQSKQSQNNSEYALNIHNVKIL